MPLSRDPTSPGFLRVRMYLPDRDTWLKWGFLDKVRVADHTQSHAHVDGTTAVSQLRLAVLTDQALHLAMPGAAGPEAARLADSTDFDALDEGAKQQILDSCDVEAGREVLVAIALHEITHFVYGGQVHELSEDEMNAMPTITRDSSLLDLTKGVAFGSSGYSSGRFLHYRKDTKRVVLVTAEGDYHLLASCEDQAVAWGEAIEHAAQEWRQKLHRHYRRAHGPAEKLRIFLDDFYKNPYVQTGLAFIILCCFASSITANTIQRHGISTDPERQRYVLEVLNRGAFWRAFTIHDDRVPPSAGARVPLGNRRRDGFKQLLLDLYQAIVQPLFHLLELLLQRMRVYVM
jgi:hypothetical protein